MIYSDVLELAYEEGEDALTFVIAHELCRNHVDASQPHQTNCSCLSRQPAKCQNSRSRIYRVISLNTFFHSKSQQSLAFVFYRFSFTGNNIGFRTAVC